MKTVTITGLVDICAVLELPTSKAKLKKIALKFGLEETASIEEIAKELMLEGLRGGMDLINERVEDASVEESDLSVEAE